MARGWLISLVALLLYAALLGLTVAFLTTAVVVTLRYLGVRV